MLPQIGPLAQENMLFKFCWHTTLGNEKKTVFQIFYKKSPVRSGTPNRAAEQISPQDIVSVLIVAREKGKGKMLKPQQLTRRRNDLERAVRGAMGRALIRTGKELGEEIGLSETQICNRMAGRSRWTLEEIWELDRVLQFTDAEKLMLIGGTK